MFDSPLPSLFASHARGLASCSKCRSTRLRSELGVVSIYACDCLGSQAAGHSPEGQILDGVIACVDCGTAHRAYVDSPQPRTHEISWN